MASVIFEISDTASIVLKERKVLAGVTYILHDVTNNAQLIAIALKV